MAKLWFRQRRYGWGWRPASIEGWLVLFVFIVGIAVGAFLFTRRVQVGGDLAAPLAYFLLWTAGLIIVLIGIAWKTGERPRWRWGDN